MLLVGQGIEGMEIGYLTEVSNIHFGIKLLLLLAITTLLVLFTLTAPLFLWIIPSVLLGCMFAHAVELQHQCLHNTAFRSTRWNRIVGVLLGMPLLVSFSDYQNSHMRHHKLLGTPEDKEFFNYGYESLTTVRAFILHLFMPRHYCDVSGFIGKAIVGRTTREDASPRIASRIANEYRLMAVFLLALAAITIAFPSLLTLKLWLVPFVVGVPVHALIELPEHIGCNTAIPDVLSNTRTIKASRFGVWFTDGNNYHVEHHWLPGVPNHNFAKVHRIVNPHGIANLETSYRSFYLNFLTLLFRNTLESAGKNRTGSV